MRQRIGMYIAVAVVLLGVLWWAAWSLMTGPLDGFVHPGFETFYGAFTICFISVVFAAALVVGAWDLKRSAPQKHEHIHFKPLMHH
jgi:hypothetical protein